MDNSGSENRAMPFDDIEYSQERLEEYLEKVKGIIDLSAGLPPSEEAREILKKLRGLYEKILCTLGRRPDDTLEQITVISDVVKSMRQAGKDAVTTELAEEMNKIADDYQDEGNDIMDKWAQRVGLL